MYACARSALHEGARSALQICGRPAREALGRHREGLQRHCDVLWFIFCRDAFLHQLQKRCFAPGAAVTFTIQLKLGCPQAFDLDRGGPTSDVAFSTQPLRPRSGATGRSRSLPPEKFVPMAGRADVCEELGSFLGTVKSFFSETGYGFIACPVLQSRGLCKDVFLHHSEIQGFKVGDEVLFSAYLNRLRQPQFRN